MRVAESFAPYMVNYKWRTRAPMVSHGCAYASHRRAYGIGAYRRTGAPMWALRRAHSALIGKGKTFSPASSRRGIPSTQPRRTRRTAYASGSQPQTWTRG